MLHHFTFSIKLKIKQTYQCLNVKIPVISLKYTMKYKTYKMKANV